jgi:N-acetylmuramoyl-L-alanine amidase
MVTHPSPNHSPRRRKIRVIVLHASAGKSDRGDVSWIQSQASKVSYHILIGRDGAAYVFVPDERRAWHAGVSTWQGTHNVNDFSLGLSWANKHDGTEPLTAAQIASADKVIRAWLGKHPSIEAVVTHQEIAPGRKSDPHKIPNFVRGEWQVERFR